MNLVFELLRCGWCSVMKWQ